MALWLQDQMEVNGQFNAPPTLLLEKGTAVPIEQEAEWNGVLNFWIKNKYLAPAKNSTTISQTLTCSLVTIPTELS